MDSSFFSQKMATWLPNFPHPRLWTKQRKICRFRNRENMWWAWPLGWGAMGFPESSRQNLSSIAAAWLRNISLTSSLMTFVLINCSIDPRRDPEFEPWKEPFFEFRRCCGKKENKYIVLCSWYLISQFDCDEFWRSGIDVYLVICPFIFQQLDFCAIFLSAKSCSRIIISIYNLNQYLETQFKF